MDRNNRKDVFWYPNNVANALPNETPETIRAYFEKYQAALLKELGDEEQVDGAAANAACPARGRPRSTNVSPRY